MPNRVTAEFGHGSKVSFELPPAAQTHVMREAFSSVQKLYTDITALLHQIDQSVDDTNEAQRQTAISALGSNLVTISEKMKVQGNVLRVVNQGEVYEDLVDRSLLGPQTDAGQRYIFDDTPGHSFSMAIGRTSGINVLIGRYDEGQPFVSINTEDLIDEFQTESGEPILAVNIGDANVYDNEGNGDKVKRDSESFKLLQRVHASGQLAGTEVGTALLEFLKES